MRSTHVLRFALVPFVSLVSVVVGACAGDPGATGRVAVPPLTTSTVGDGPASPPPSGGAAALASPGSPAFDPVAVGMTAEGSRHLCDDHLGRARALMAQIKSLKGAPADQLTYDATLGRFDAVSMEISDAGMFNGLMEVAAPDADVRAAAKECAPKIDSLTTTLYLDAGIASVLKAYAAKGEKLDVEKTRLLADTLRDFRRNGLELAPEKQAILRDLNAQITETGQKFDANIASSGGKIAVLPRQLDGLSPEWIAKHPPNPQGKVEITTDYPDYIPFQTYAKDRAAVLELYIQFTNRGGDDNVALLSKLLALRSQKAKLLGYASWADYAVEPRMAKTATAVHDFLASVSAAVKEPAKKEYAELLAQHVALGGKPTDVLQAPDRFYLADQVRAKKYAFDSKELASYFEVSAVTKGLLDVTAKMYGLEYRPVPANAWHPDVTAYEVWSGGKLIGKFYLDLYSRKDKYKHAAMFPLRQARKLEDGSYQLPLAALECNFPHPSSDPAQPALMTQGEVSTFFHEFGHVLHQLLTTSELATYSGANAVQDFVEAPSQMFEEWTWSREVLDLFARHYKTGEKIPDALFQSMTRSRTFGRALETQRQLFLATLDFEYHAREPGFDTTKVLQEVQASVDSFPYVLGTHYQSSFGHLNGYGAGYYGYQWALAISRDVLTRFKKEGLLNPRTASAWREDVLSKGGGVDERTMLTAFLGRPPSNDAYFAYLRGQD